MGSIGCPETSVRNYHYSLCNNSEERSSNLGLLYHWRRRRRNLSKRRTVNDPATRRDKPQTVRQHYPQCRHQADKTQTSPRRDINIQAKKSVEWSMAILKLRATLDGSTLSLVRWHEDITGHSKRKWQTAHGKAVSTGTRSKCTRWPAARRCGQNCCHLPVSAWHRSSCSSNPQTPHCSLTVYCCVHFDSHNKDKFIFYPAGNCEFSGFCRGVAQISVFVRCDAAPLETKLSRSIGGILPSHVTSRAIGT